MKRLHRNNNNTKLAEGLTETEEKKEDWQGTVSRHFMVTEKQRRSASLSQRTGAVGFSLTGYLSRRWRVKVSLIFFFRLLQQVEAGLKLFPKQRQVRERGVA